jgi:hypothetical protein
VYFLDLFDVLPWFLESAKGEVMFEVVVQLLDLAAPKQGG